MSDSSSFDEIHQHVISQGGSDIGYEPGKKLDEITDKINRIGRKLDNGEGDNSQMYAQLGEEKKKKKKMLKHKDLTDDERRKIVDAVNEVGKGIDKTKKDHKMLKQIKKVFRRFLP